MVTPHRSPPSPGITVRSPRRRDPDPWVPRSRLREPARSSPGGRRLPSSGAWSPESTPPSGVEIGEAAPIMPPSGPAPTENRSHSRKNDGRPAESVRPARRSGVGKTGSPMGPRGPGPPGSEYSLAVASGRLASFPSSDPAPDSRGRSSSSPGVCNRDGATWLAPDQPRAPHFARGHEPPTLTSIASRPPWEQTTC